MDNEKIQTDAAARDGWLLADDAALCSQCRLDFFRSTGNGGQKRNKCSTAVRLIHGPSGIAVTCDTERSQHRNRVLALEKLRKTIALTCRAEWREATVVDILHWKRLPELARLLDCLAFSEYRLSDAAERLGSSTAKLVKLLSQDTALFAAVNRERGRLGLSPLKMDL